MLSYSNFEKAVQDRIVGRIKNICEDIKNEYLEEMDKEYEKLKKKYSFKMEEEVQKALTDEVIQIAQDTHFYCEENIERNNTTILMKIGGL